MTRKMGIDYGTVRIGIAISDPLGITARGIETIRWNGQDMEWALNRIVQLCAENQVDTVIVGLPRRTDGKISTSEDNARLLAQRIEEAVNSIRILQTKIQGTSGNLDFVKSMNSDSEKTMNANSEKTMNADSEKSENSDYTKIETNQIKVILKDERYTSVLANRIMREVGIKPGKKREVVDQIAAEIILQDFLDHCRT